MNVKLTEQEMKEIKDDFIETVLRPLKRVSKCAFYDEYAQAYGVSSKTIRRICNTPYRVKKEEPAEFDIELALESIING